MFLFGDLETFSETPIKFGTHKYAEDPKAKILLWGYAIDNAPAKVWQVQYEPIPDDLLAAIRQIQKGDRGDFHVWHNGMNFDTVFIERVMPELAMPLDRVEDTMQIAYEHGLPGSLADLCAIYKLGKDKAKDKDGARLIRLFCVPRADGAKNRETNPEDWQRFVNYCRLDVEAERELYRRLPKINRTGRERDLAVIDAEINRRGMLMDVDLARAAVDLMEHHGAELRAQTMELTDGALDTTTRTQATIDYIKDTWGIELANLRKGEIEHLAESPDLPEPMKELLRIRLNAAKAGVKKFQSLLDCANSDGRLRGCLQFRGASRTGRFSGRLFQPQNLARPTMKDEPIEDAIEAVKRGDLDLLYSPSEFPAVLSNCLRGAIIVPEGKRMVVADYSNIEGRVLAWLAGESWKLDAFRAYDAGTGPDLYKLTYSKAFSVPVESVTKAQRQMGKVLELAMGYGGGPGAFVTFAMGYGIDLHDMAKATLPVVPADVRDEAERAYEWAATTPKRLCGLEHDVWIACDSVKRLWRRANPHIVAFWGRVEEACVASLQTYCTEHLHRGLKTWASKGWLGIVLPSNRTLLYPSARVGTEDEGCTFSYMGVHQMTRKWQRIKTYGGKVVENITQAVACDVLCNALFNVDRAGFEPILTVHDEILTEAPDDDAHDFKQLEAAMEILPHWAKGLPLAAAGFSSYRYHK